MLAPPQLDAPQADKPAQALHKESNVGTEHLKPPFEFLGSHVTDEATGECARFPLRLSRGGVRFGLRVGAGVVDWVGVGRMSALIGEDQGQGFF